MVFIIYYILSGISCIEYIFFDFSYMMILYGCLRYIGECIVVDDKLGFIIIFNGIKIFGKCIIVYDKWRILMISIVYIFILWICIGIIIIFIGYYWRIMFVLWYFYIWINCYFVMI